MMKTEEKIKAVRNRDASYRDKIFRCRQNNENCLYTGLSGEASGKEHRVL